MTNHFKTATKDPEIKERYKDKPFHMAVLQAFSKYVEKSNKVKDLPWFLPSVVGKTVKKEENRQ